MDILSLIHETVITLMPLFWCLFFCDEGVLLSSLWGQVPPLPPPLLIIPFPMFALQFQERDLYPDFVIGVPLFVLRIYVYVASRARSLLVYKGICSECACTCASHADSADALHAHSMEAVYSPDDTVPNIPHTWPVRVCDTPWLCIASHVPSVCVQVTYWECSHHSVYRNHLNNLRWYQILVHIYMYMYMYVYWICTMCVHVASTVHTSQADIHWTHERRGKHGFHVHMRTMDDCNGFPTEYWCRATVPRKPLSCFSCVHIISYTCIFCMTTSAWVHVAIVAKCHSPISVWLRDYYWYVYV